MKNPCPWWRSYPGRFYNYEAKYTRQDRVYFAGMAQMRPIEKFNSLRSRFIKRLVVRVTPRGYATGSKIQTVYSRDQYLPGMTETSLYPRRPRMRNLIRRFAEKILASALKKSEGAGKGPETR